MHDKINKMVSAADWLDLKNRFLSDCSAIPSEVSQQYDLMNKIQHMYWYYIDFRKPCEFSDLYNETIQQMQWSPQDAWNAWKTYEETERNATRCGAIITDQEGEHVLLVRGVHSKFWSFPCGKQMHNEDLTAAALREVWEEVGLRGEAKGDPIHWTSDRGKRLFLIRIPNVRHDTVFRPRLRKEIERVAWFKWKHLKRHMPRWIHPLIDAVSLV